MKQHELICISCPVGCPLIVEVDGTEMTVNGHKCRLGITYATKEVTDPRRLITTSMKVFNEDATAYQLMSVKTDKDIPKAQIMTCVKAIKAIKVQGDFSVGDVVIKNILDLDVNIVATRDIRF